MRIKIVPDNDPNADGEVIEVATRNLSFAEECTRYADAIPEGFHAVQFDDSKQIVGTVILPVPPEEDPPWIRGNQAGWYP